MRKWLSRIPMLPVIYRKARRAVRYCEFAADFLRYRRLQRLSSETLPLRWTDRYVCLDDRTADMRYERSYVYHLAWAARILVQTRPREHIDMASHIFFTTMLSACIPMRYYDCRPTDVQLDGLVTGAADLRHLPFSDKSVPSLSCLHVLEHVGLGRYGDPIEPGGYRKAMAELSRVVAPGGNLLIAVPIGRRRIEFNAHRVLNYQDVMDGFEGLKLRQFALIPDNPKDGGLIIGASAEQADRQSYGCGCFWFEGVR